jgi:hypothetical protein
MKLYGCEVEFFFLYLCRKLYGFEIRLSASLK